MFHRIQNLTDTERNVKDTGKMLYEKFGVVNTTYYVTMWAT